MDGLTPADAWRGTIQLDSVRTIQLGPGEFVLERSVADLSLLRCVSLRSEVGFKGYSELLPGRSIIGVTADPFTNARWFGEPVDSDHIIQTQTAMDLTMHGRSKMFFVATDTDHLESNSRRRVHRSVEYADVLRCYLSSGIQLARSAAREAKRLRTVGQNLTFLLGLCLGEGGALSESRTLGRRVMAVRKCEEYLFDHLEDNPTLLELCVVAEMRPRSLCNAFLAVTGMTPMTYLRIHRLNGVHKALMARGESKIRIMDVAADWGFWHMGHFTMSYRKMFGESPSETANRNL